MPTETVRDSNFRIIGYIETDDRGNKTIRDSSFQTTGRYDAQYNRTTKPDFSIVAYGDQSSMMLPKKP